VSARSTTAGAALNLHSIRIEISGMRFVWPTGLRDAHMSPPILAHRM
jgi:hypothetical protein